MRTCLLTGVMVLLVLTAGCQRLNHEKEIDLEQFTVYKAMFDAPTYNQKVTATIEPKDSAVSAYLVTDANLKAVEKALQENTAPDAKLALAQKTAKRGDPKENFTIEASVPAKTAFALVLYTPQKNTKVKFKVVGK